MKIQNKQNFKQGFTLLELLVVVLIIGLLAAIALPQYRKAVGRAELAQVISATKAIQNAQERFYLANGSYATNLEDLDINLPNNTVKCTLMSDSYGKYSRCHNNNYIFSHNYSQGYRYNKTECYGKTKQLVSACESFLEKTAGSTNNVVCSSILNVPTCWAIFGVTIPM